MSKIENEHFEPATLSDRIKDSASDLPIAFSPQCVIVLFNVVLLTEYIIRTKSKLDD